ncbi:hypothetical protein ACJX0J_029970, partial [Zea mays]
RMGFSPKVRLWFAPSSAGPSSGHQASSPCAILYCHLGGEARCRGVCGGFVLALAKPGAVAAEAAPARPVSLIEAIPPPLLGGSGDLILIAPDPSIWGGPTLTWMSIKGGPYFILDDAEVREMWEELRLLTQLALRSAEVVDLTSQCVGLKEEGAADRAKLLLRVNEIHRLKAEADLREEEMRQLKGNLQAVAVERDESRRQVAKASLCVDSLSKHLEAERFEGLALKAWMG